MTAHVIDAASGHTLEAKRAHVSMLLPTVKTNGWVSAAEVRAAERRLLTVIVRRAKT